MKINKTLIKIFPLILYAIISIYHSAITLY
ncbi:Uncharacterised protein [Legionella lansingensis]|nr:Uncharacterised protein [Legionella lansingensis]